MIKQLLMNDNKISTNRFVLIIGFIVSSIVVLYTSVANPEHLGVVLGFYSALIGTLTVSKGVRDLAKDKLDQGEHAKQD